jgi:hypothetical protein
VPDELKNREEPFVNTCGPVSGIFDELAVDPAQIGATRREPLTGRQRSWRPG